MNELWEVSQQKEKFTETKKKRKEVKFPKKQAPNKQVDRKRKLESSKIASKKKIVCPVLFGDDDEHTLDFDEDYLHNEVNLPEASKPSPKSSKPSKLSKSEPSAEPPKHSTKPSSTSE